MLEENPPGSFRVVVRIWNQTIQEVQFLLEMGKELLGGSFPSVSEMEIGDVGGDQ